MSIIAGAYSRKTGVPVPTSVCESIKRLISRNPSDEVKVFGDRHAFLAKVDICAFDERGEYVSSDGSVSLAAGEPLLVSAAGTVASRQADIRRIHAGFAVKDYSILTEANSTYCAVNYDANKRRLSLITGKLGIRPLYYWLNDDLVIFASALRVLEGMVEVPKRMNVRAVTEMAGLGYALADRTPYADISVLKAGEMLQIRGQESSRSIYWRWNEIGTSTASEDDLLDELYRRFENAVSRRLRGDTSAIAYLSGGLDSRCVVASLCAQHARVHTFNFARPGTQDQTLGRLYAELENVIHTETPKDAGDQRPDYSTLMTTAWASSANHNNCPPEHPHLAWSGEGGSVDLGHVHLSRKIVSLMRDGDTDGAIQEFMQRESIHVSPKLLNAEAYKQLESVIPVGIREELDDARSADPARSFYLFLMLNDQRRKLAGHFENIDLHRRELQMPFFDNAVVELILSIPVDLCLEHRLYVKWLSRFPAAVTSVAWQGYPGHVPCPLPVPDGLSYQWEAGYQAAEQRALKQTLNERARRLIGSKNFASRILNKKNIRLAALIHRTGWRDYGYIIETADIYQEYWAKCNGEYSLS